MCNDSCKLELSVDASEHNQAVCVFEDNAFVAIGCEVFCVSIETGDINSSVSWSTSPPQSWTSLLLCMEIMLSPEPSLAWPIVP